jgi:hypothetical protein
VQKENQSCEKFTRKSPKKIFNPEGLHNTVVCLPLALLCTLASASTGKGCRLGEFTGHDKSGTTLA